MNTPTPRDREVAEKIIASLGLNSNPGAVNQTAQLLADSMPTQGWVPVCDICNKLLTEPGAVIIGPPLEEDRHEKIHCCVKCWQAFTFSNFPLAQETPAMEKSKDAELAKHRDLLIRVAKHLRGLPPPLWAEIEAALTPGISPAPEIFSQHAQWHVENGTMTLQEARNYDAGLQLDGKPWPASSQPPPTEGKV